MMSSSKLTNLLNNTGVSWNTTKFGPMNTFRNSRSKFNQLFINSSFSSFSPVSRFTFGNLLHCRHMHPEKECKIKTIGIRRENKGNWEGRVPLIPQDISILMRETGVKFIIQPCTRRAIRDEEFIRAGATVSEDLDSCDLVIGVKEIPIEQIKEGKSYLCFSHTHKGQSQNMPFLKRAIDKKITLLDYELLRDEKTGERLVAYGQYAGIAGMIDCLHGLGYRLLLKGFRTPFVNIAPANNYLNLDEAIRAITLVGKDISKYGLNCPSSPLVFCFTGDGNVSKGARSIFNLLPHVMIKPDDPIPPASTAPIIGMVCKAEHYMIDPDTGKFDPEMFSRDPFKLKGIFAEKIGKNINVLINGIYWESKYPRVLSNQDAKSLSDRIYSIADISCDIKGSIEFTTKITTIDDPFFIYDPITEGELNKSDSNGIQILAVDNLPAQLPLNASQYFSTRLLPIMKCMIFEGFDHPLISKAAIIKRGKLMIPELEDQFNVKGLKSGNAFVKEAINSNNGVNDKLSNQANSPSNSNYRSSNAKKEICILGSGYVVGPVIDYLSKLSNVSSIKIGTNNLQEGINSIKGIVDDKEGTGQKGEKKISVCMIDATNANQVNAFIRDSFLVISLVPAPLHVAIARECIKNRIHMITASYISPEMMTLDDQAKKANIIILNEVGLDPGLDHISALDLIKNIRSEGDEVVEFTSWCGGLPVPECANNPFRYKFSWNPKGALMASQNPATFLRNNKVVNIKGGDLMKSVESLDVHPIIRFEGYFNRDSLKYIDLYRLRGIKTMIRGTLRYKGFAKMVDNFKRLGFFNNNIVINSSNDTSMGMSSSSSASLSPLSPLSPLSSLSSLSPLSPLKGRQTMFEFTKSVIGSEPDTSHFLKIFGNEKDAQELNDAIDWLGMLSKDTMIPLEESFSHCTVFDIFCKILQGKLSFAPDERDLVFMAHNFVISSANGNLKKLQSNLIELGDQHMAEAEKRIGEEGIGIKRYSAMARTVGYPVAISSKLIVDDMIEERGVIGPMIESIYRPMLYELEKIPIRFSNHLVNFNNQQLAM